MLYFKTIQILANENTFDIRKKIQEYLDKKKKCLELMSEPLYITSYSFPQFEYSIWWSKESILWHYYTDFNHS